MRQSIVTITLNATLLAVVVIVGTSLWFYATRIRRSSRLTADPGTGRHPWLQEHTSLMLWLGMFLVLCGDVLQMPATQNALNTAVGANITWPVKWVVVGTGALFFQIFALQVSTDPFDPNAMAAVRRSTIRRSGTWIILLAATLVLFSRHPHDPDFLVGPTSRQATPGPVSPTVAASWFILEVWECFAYSSQCRRCLRWSRTTRVLRGAALRLSTGLLALGSVIGVAYGLAVIAFHLIEVTGATPWIPQQTVTAPLIALAPLVTGIGLVLPGLASWRASRRRASTALRLLDPLWNEARRLVSTDAHRRSRFGQWWQRQSPRRLLQGRVVVLWDARLRLRTHLATDVLPHAERAATAANLGQPLTTEVIDAVTFAHAFPPFVASSQPPTDYDEHPTDDEGVGQSQARQRHTPPTLLDDHRHAEHPVDVDALVAAVVDAARHHRTNSHGRADQTLAPRLGRAPTTSSDSAPVTTTGQQERIDLSPLSSDARRFVMAARLLQHTGLISGPTQPEHSPAGKHGQHPSASTGVLDIAETA